MFSELDRWDPRNLQTTGSFRWQATTLGDIAKVRLGLQVPRKGSRPVGVVRPYLRAANVRRGNIDVSDVKQMHVSESQAVELELQNGDILIVEGSGSVAEVGRTAMWNAEVQGSVIHQNSVVRARLYDREVLPEFVATWFNCRAGNAYIRDQATTTSGLYHIGAGKLLGAPIPVPPVHKQEELVAEYREALEQAVRQEGEALELDNAARVRFAAALVENDGCVESTQLVKTVQFSELDRWDTAVAAKQMKSKYSLLMLGQIADVRLGTQIPRRGTTRVGSAVPYLRAANVQRGYCDLHDMKNMWVSAAIVDRLQVRDGDVLFVEGNSREEVGRSAVWQQSRSADRVIIQNSIVRARLNSGRLLPEYVSAWFNSDVGARYIRDHATSTSGSLWHIGAAKLAAAPIPAPTVLVQAKTVEDLNRSLDAAAEMARRADESRERAEVDLRNALYDTDS